MSGPWGVKLTPVLRPVSTGARQRPFGSRGPMITMGINHFLNGMILQCHLPPQGNSGPYEDLFVTGLMVVSNPLIRPAICFFGGVALGGGPLGFP